MWISRKIASITTTSTTTADEESPTSNKKAIMERFNKPLPPLSGGQHVEEPLTIVVSGESNIGKSTFIRFGLQNLIAKHDSNRPDLHCHHTKIILDQHNYPVDVIEWNSGTIIETEDLPVIHGGIVCYDTTDRDSLDCIPDLLNFYLSRNIPTFLVGLKADLTESCQIDPNLIQQLVELFDLRHFQVDAFSESGVEQMRNIYKILVKQYYPQAIEVKLRPNTMLISNESSKTTTKTTTGNTGFIYAPTRKSSFEDSTIDQVSVTSGSEADPDKSHSENKYYHNVVSTANTFPVGAAATNTAIHMTNTNKRGTFPSHLSSRRGSKDSSESFGIGLTTDDIIDRLLSTEYNKGEENIIPIFLTFFRKFMKPFELVKILVDRFEDDGLSLDASPTVLQKRIHSIFSLWLSHYWNDFYGSHARKHIILFLDRISKYEHFTPICDSLAPLVVREPPSDDPDRFWGLIDDEEQELDDDDELISPPTTPIRSQRSKRNEKKDSAYASGTFSIVVPQSPTGSETGTNTPPFLLKRMSSNNFQRKMDPSSTTPPSPSLLSPNLNRLLLRSHSKIVTHSESHPDLRSSYAAAHTSTTNTPVVASSELPRRAEFAGGLINIDNAIKPKNHYKVPSSMAPSIATTSGGGGSRWTSSLGNQLLASSFISSFRQHRFDKDETSHNYKIFMKSQDIAVADQLTWIEAELFSKIKPREFIRNIWNNPVNNNNTLNKHNSISSTNSINSNNTVMASIAHFNFISAWVVTMIVTQSRLSKRVALLQKFMSIAVELRNLNNYNSLMAILAGINSASVLRLKQTRQAVSTKKVYKQFQSLERLMSTDKSFSSYRMALKASGAPGIPYLGIHNQDLVSLAEANKDFRADGTIHWEKFRLMGETIMATMKFKCPRYTIEPDAKLLAFIADTYILSEDEQYKRSIVIEPRLASSSTNRIRDLWLRM